MKCGVGPVEHMGGWFNRLRVIAPMIAACALLVSAGLMSASSSGSPSPAGAQTESQAGAKAKAPALLAQAIKTTPVPESAPGKPAMVVVGAYLNDVEEIDFMSHSYSIDFYVWFRWRDASIDPSKTTEFMNRFAPYDSVRTELYDKPQKMPDGSLYAILRVQEQFSRKFPLENYPFDTQKLTIVMEDSLSGADDLTYLPDGRGVTMNPAITLPGFTVGKPVMTVTRYHYPTFFGDISDPTATDYSRVTISVPVRRPAVAMTIKTFVPIVLIVICAALVFFVRPTYVEGRIGLGITALLTLVALQLAASAALPDVDYLTMLDKVYLVAYLFIILALARIVATSWAGHETEREADISRADKVWVTILLAAYCIANAAIAYSTLWWL